MSKKSQILHKLTRQFVQDLIKKGGNGSEQIYKDIDKKANGLMLKISPTGRVSYHVHGRIKVGEKPNTQFIKIGNAAEISLMYARDQAQEFYDLMDQGLHPAKYLKSIKVYTLEDLHKNYLKERELREDTIKEYNKAFDRLSVKFRQHNALTIMRDDVIKEHQDISIRNTPFMSDKTFQHVGALYRQAMKTLLDSDELSLVKKNPVEVLNDKKMWFVNNGQSRRKSECIDTDDLSYVLQAIEEMKSYRGDKKFVHKDSHSAIVASHFFRFLLFTGWRPEEVCKITWKQVSTDLRDVTWDDRDAAEALKNAEEQYRAPLNREATKTLESIKAYNFTSKFVFPNVTLTSHFKQNPTDYVNLLEKMVGTDKRYTCGIYRKTFQTYAEFVGIHEVTIKRLVFHTQKHYTTQGGYIFANREHLRRQSQRVADFILYYANRDELVEFQDVDISMKLIEAAREEIKKDENNHQVVSEVLEHWIEIGRKFERM